MKILESKVEDTACRWAKEQGWKHRKYKTPNHRSSPDRIFMKEGRVVFIEFKRPKTDEHQAGKLSPGQEKEIKSLREAGMEVHVCFSVQEAKEVLQYGAKVDLHDPTNEVTKCS